MARPIFWEGKKGSPQFKPWAKIPLVKTHKLVGFCVWHAWRWSWVCALRIIGPSKGRVWSRGKVPPNSQFWGSGHSGWKIVQKKWKPENLKPCWWFFIRKNVLVNPAWTQPWLRHFGTLHAPRWFWSTGVNEQFRSRFVGGLREVGQDMAGCFGSNHHGFHRDDSKYVKHGER